MARAWTRFGGRTRRDRRACPAWLTPAL